MKKRIGFRVDANEHIASGHLMRCIAIALECMKSGNECIFFMAEEKQEARLQQNKIPYYILNSQWNCMEEELDKMTEWIKRENLDLLVVDSYQATKNYLNILNAHVPVCYLDDMGEEVYPIASLLHYSAWPDDEEYMKPYQNSDTKVMCGMQYVPLRSEFTGEIYESQRERSILITTGGTDPYNITGKVLKELLSEDLYKEFIFKVIVGGMNTNIEQLQELAKDERVRLLYNVSNMGELMKSSQYAISAGGTTLFELCACKVPTVCFSFAENQRAFTEEMGKRKVMLYAGDAREDADIEKVIVENVSAFVLDDKLNEEYVSRMMQLVDGKGTERIAEFFEKIACDKRC